MATHGAGGGRHKFFKVLLPGSFELDQLDNNRSQSVPPKFAADLGAWRPWRAAAAKLRDRTGRSWDVDLHRDGDHRVSFTSRGWRGFVSANGISAGQLLVFEHRGCLDFAVDLFDASGCLSERTTTTSACCDNGCHEVEAGPKAAMTETTGDKESGNCRRRREAAAAPGTGVKRRKRSPSTATTGSGDDETLCRRIERPYQLRFLDLSKSFCDAVGWTSSRDVELCAAGDREQRWQVSVKVSAKSGMMCAGWTEFAQDNGLSLSDACVFVPLEGSHGGVLQVRVLRTS